MKIYVTIDATLEFDMSKATVEPEFIESAVEEFAILVMPGLAKYLKEKAVDYVGTRVTGKEVIAE